MGWKGLARSLGAAARQAERNAARQQRQAFRQALRQQRENALVEAEIEVRQCHESLRRLLSIHKECGKSWDWVYLLSIASPALPEPHREAQHAAELMLDRYQASILDRLFKREEKKRRQLRADLGKAQQLDSAKDNAASQKFAADLAAWQSQRRIAEGVIADDLNIFQEVLRDLGPFAQIADIGSQVEFRANDTSRIEVFVKAHSQEIIPKESKTLLKSGKVSVKKLPPVQFGGLYQSYLCSCALHVGREAFALLPFDLVIVHMLGPVLNLQTGYIEEVTILSAAMPRATFLNLCFDAVDPRDAMNNFVHRMKLSPKRGVEAVERLSPEKFMKTPGG